MTTRYLPYVFMETALHCIVDEHIFFKNETGTCLTVKCNKLKQKGDLKLSLRQEELTKTVKVLYEWQGIMELYTVFMKSDCFYGLYDLSVFHNFFLFFFLSVSAQLYITGNT